MFLIAYNKNLCYIQFQFPDQFILFQAAVFNQTEIAFALMDSGANLNYKNAQGNNNYFSQMEI